MIKIYDKTNDYLYAEGNTGKELIEDWNNKAENNFSWLLDNLLAPDKHEDYDEATEKQENIRGIEKIIDKINNIEVNNLAIYENGIRIYK